MQVFITSRTCSRIRLLGTVPYTKAFEGSNRQLLSLRFARGSGHLGAHVTVEGVAEFLPEINTGIGGGTYDDWECCSIPTPVQVITGETNGTINDLTLEELGYLFCCSSQENRHMYK